MFTCEEKNILFFYFSVKLIKIGFSSVCLSEMKFVLALEEQCFLFLLRNWYYFSFLLIASNIKLLKIVESKIFYFKMSSDLH